MNFMYTLIRITLVAHTFSPSFIIEWVRQDEATWDLTEDSTRAEIFESEDDAILAMSELNIEGVTLVELAEKPISAAAIVSAEDLVNQLVALA